MRFSSFLSRLGLACGLVGLAGAAGAVTFSVDAISPTVTGSASSGTTSSPGDILGDFPPATPTPVLGTAIVVGASSGAEVDGFSFGRALSQFSTSVPGLFSVDRGSFGVSGSAVAIEAAGTGTTSEQGSDVFRSSYGGANTLFRDGDGIPISPNPVVPGLGVAEPFSQPPPTPPLPPTLVGNVDALDARGDAVSPPPTGTLFLSLDTASATGSGLSGGDVLIDVGLTGTTSIYAPASALGLFSTDDIDALVVFDNGDGVFLPGLDIVLFSLAPGSPGVGSLDSVSGLVITEGDVLIDSTAAITLLGAPATSTAPGILHTAESLGLISVRGGFAGSNNLNAFDIVPEPGSALLLVSGIAGLALIRRRLG
ncbi:MAG: PEP-CTERM sorting domain-containing protein [Myxococcota bacterium]